MEQAVMGVEMTVLLYLFRSSAGFCPDRPVQQGVLACAATFVPSLVL